MKVQSQSLLCFYSYKQWDQAVQCLAVIDVLISLSNFSMAGEDVMCRPEFVEPTKDTKVVPLKFIQKLR